MEGAADASATLESLFRAHADDVCRIVSRLMGPGTPEADVDDLAQQAFIAMHRALPRFRGDSRVSTWVYGITTRVVLQHLRSRRRYQAMIDRFEAASQQTVYAPDVEETVAQREALHRIYGALLRMKPEQRVVFVLAEIEGLSAREIGRSARSRRRSGSVPVAPRAAGSPAAAFWPQGGAAMMRDLERDLAQARRALDDGRLAPSRRARLWARIESARRADERRWRVGIPVALAAAAAVLGVFVIGWPPTPEAVGNAGCGSSEGRRRRSCRRSGA